MIATTEPWPELQPTLRSLDDQVAALGGELIVADGDGAGGPEAPTRSPLQRVVRPGASVFELRAAGAATAQGRVVAVTEDHCLAEPGWAAGHVDAHRRRPDAAAIAGAITNGSRARLVHWASYLLTFAEFAPPLRDTHGSRVPPPANVSYKREVLEEPVLRVAGMELELIGRLVREGRVDLVNGITMAHVQPYSLRAAVAAHFHNGRATFGLEGDSVPRGRALARELARRAPLPRALVAETRVAMAGKRLGRRARASLPLVLLLALAHTAGECAGLLAGPGRSPARLN